MNVYSCNAEAGTNVASGPGPTLGETCDVNADGGGEKHGASAIRSFFPYRHDTSASVLATLRV